MRTLNVSTTLATLALLLGVGFPAFATGGGDTPRGNAVSRGTGEQLFRGLILGSGPVAEAVPEIRDFLRAENFTRDKNRLADVRLVHERIVAAVRAHDPAAFERLQLAIRTGSHLKIQKALRSASRTAEEAVASSMPEVAKLRTEIANNPKMLFDLRAELKRQAQENLTPADATRRSALVLLMGGDRSLRDGNGECVLVIVVATLAIAINYVWVAQVVTLVEAVTVAIAANIYIEEEAEFASASSATRQLLGERLVHSVARLAVH